MRRFLLLVMLTYGSVLSSTAQSTIAKSKYENAEEAYSKGNYTTALNNLNEAQRLLGTVSPKIDYLRIMTFAELSRTDTTYIIKAEREIDKYISYSEKFNIDLGKLRDVTKLKETLRINIMKNIAHDREINEQQVTSNRQKAEHTQEALDKFNSFQITYDNLAIGTTGIDLEAWKKGRPKIKDVNNDWKFKQVIKAVINVPISAAVYLKGGEYKGGFIYSKDKKTAAGIFICPIYTNKMNKIDVEYETLRQKLESHFGASNLEEGSAITETDEVFKFIRLKDNSNGLICMGIMMGRFYSWIYSIKLDYHLLSPQVN